MSKPLLPGQGFWKGATTLGQALDPWAALFLMSVNFVHLLCEFCGWMFLTGDNNTKNVSDKSRLMTKEFISCKFNRDIASTHKKS